MAVLSSQAGSADLPAGKPPPGVTPNFAHPYTDGPVLVGVGGAFTALALFFVSARIHTKLRFVRKWSPDDSKLGEVYSFLDQNKHEPLTIHIATCTIGAVSLQ